MDRQFVGIVDEVNVLEDPGTLVELDYLPTVTLILACVDEDDFYADADGTVLSRFRGAEKIRLERYSADELSDILWNRVEHGLVAGVVDGGVVEEIADRAAGDARHGIVLLRKAVRRAQRNGADHVTVDDVQEAAEDARVEIIERYLSSLGTNMRLLFQIIREEGALRGEELKAKYEARASDPVGDTVRNEYLDALESHGRIVSDGTGRGKWYRVAERKPTSGTV
jgi:Cdc6-like AAA superfamily ATPase